MAAAVGSAPPESARRRWPCTGPGDCPGEGLGVGLVADGGAPRYEPASRPTPTVGCSSPRLIPWGGDFPGRQPAAEGFTRWHQPIRPTQPLPSVPVRCLLVSLALLTTGLSVGCSGTQPLTYDAHVTYLQTTVQRGVEAHRLLVSQGATPTVERCGAAFDGTVTDIPQDHPEAYQPENRLTKQWQEQVRAFFIDSCTSGKPTPVPSATSSPTPAASPSTSPTR